MRRWAARPAPGRSSWTRSPAAAPSPWRPCAWGRTPSPATSTPWPCCSTRSCSNTSPSTGKRLADEVRKWGEWIKREAEKELAEFYPKDADGATPIAYLWARTIQCEGPGCGAEVPLMRSLWLAKKANRSVALRLVPGPRAKRVDFQIIVNQREGWVDQADPGDKDRKTEARRNGQTRLGHLPVLWIHTPVPRVRDQLKARRGGANATLVCVVSAPGRGGARRYRLHKPTTIVEAVGAADK